MTYDTLAFLLEHLMTIEALLIEDELPPVM